MADPAPNPYAKYLPPQPAQAAPTALPRAPQVGAPVLTFPVDPTKQAAEARAQEAADRAARAETRAAEREGLPAGYQWTDDTHTAQEPIPGGPAAGAGRLGRAMRQGDADKLETQINAYDYLRDSAANFQDDFAGNAVTGELENWAQGKIGTGTPGQRDWWANFRTADNSIRNALFGASLTEGEKAAYEQTTVDPSMTPAEVRRNLKRRVEVARDILRRRVGRLYSVYNKDEIEAALGEYQSDLLDGQEPSEATPLVGRSPEGDEEPENYWPGVVGEDGKPLPPEGGYGKDPETGEWGMYGRITDDSPMEAAGVRSDPTSALARADAFIRGAADVVTLGLADEIAAAGDTVFGGGTMEDNLEDQRRTDRFDEQNNFKYRLAGQVGGGFLLPEARAGGALKGAGVGAAYGGAYGFGSGTGDIGDRLASAGTGALVGGGVGAVAGRFAKPKGGGGPSPTGPTGRDVYDAAKRLDIDVMPADVGGPTTRLVTAGFGATPGGTYPIAKGAERTVEGAEAARDRVARWFGTASPDELAGQTATQGALKFRSESRDRVGRLYEKVARETGDVRIEPKQATEAIDRNIAELSAIPGASEQVRALQGLKDELTKLGPLTVQGVRGMRTALRDRFMKEGLTGSDLERRVNEVVEAASEDLAEGLLENGMTEQSALLRQADRQWRERMATMNEVILPIIGKRGEKSGEQVFQALRSATEGNNRRFSQFMDSLPEAERNTVAASIIGALGRGSPAEGGAFSLGKFFTDWSKLGETARNALLTPQARAALDDLATVAGARKVAEKSLNRSNTGLVGMTGATLLLDSMVTMGGTLAGQYGIGRLLSSPLVTRTLVKFSRAKTPEARARILQSFDEIAASQPAAANDIAEIRDALTRGLSRR